MAKNMAKLENNIVTNILWCSDRAAETDTLKNVGDYMVAIGDTYADGYFYRNGERCLTQLEVVQKEADAQISILLDTIEELIIGG